MVLIDLIVVSGTEVAIAKLVADYEVGGLQNAVRNLVTPSLRVAASVQLRVSPAALAAEFPFWLFRLPAGFLVAA